MSTKNNTPYMEGKRQGMNKAIKRNRHKITGRKSKR